MNPLKGMFLSFKVVNCCTCMYILNRKITFIDYSSWYANSRMKDCKMVSKKYSLEYKIHWNIAIYNYNSYSSILNSRDQQGNVAMYGFIRIKVSEMTTFDLCKYSTCTSVGTILYMIKIYSSRSSYYFLSIYSYPVLSDSLPAVWLGCTMARTPVFLTIRI